MSKKITKRAFRMDELFDIHTPAKKFNANTVKFGGKYPYVARGSSNNGIRGYITEDPRYLNPANTLSFGQDTATVYYQSKVYFTGDKIKILELKGYKLDEKIALYLIPTIRKAFSNFVWGQSSFDENVLKGTTIMLPVCDDDTPDWDYMSECVRELERERVYELEEERAHELDAYLEVTGLDDCELTDEEKASVTTSHINGATKWERFPIGDLFFKVNTEKSKSFNKKTDTRTTPDAEFSLPLVNAKMGDNGIMFYARPSDVSSESMTIDIIQNGAVAAGKVYAQPQKTGVLWDAYLIKLINEPQNMSSQILLFLATSIEKTIREQFTYDKKATWERVKEAAIYLPVKAGSPDWDFMQKYIRATEKFVIADVVKRKDEQIELTKKIVNQEVG